MKIIQIWVKLVQKNFKRVRTIKIWLCFLWYGADLKIFGSNFGLKFVWVSLHILSEFANRFSKGQHLKCYMIKCHTWDTSVGWDVDLCEIGCFVELSDPAKPETDCSGLRRDPLEATDRNLSRLLDSDPLGRFSVRIVRIVEISEATRLSNNSSCLKFKNNKVSFIVALSYNLFYLPIRSILLTISSCCWLFLAISFCFNLPMPLFGLASDNEPVNYNHEKNALKRCAML